MAASPNYKKGVVILDIDGVLNSFSNRRFYLSFVYKSVKCLAKVRGRKELIKNLPKLRHCGINGLFRFAREYCGDAENFDRFGRQLIASLNFDLIKNDFALVGFIKRLCRQGKVIIRSDGMRNMAYAVWERVIRGRSSAKIKQDILGAGHLPPKTSVYIKSREIVISGIEDNFFHPKSEVKGWERFAEIYNVDLTRSVLIDDSRRNTELAKKLGMTTVRISHLDSFLGDTVLKDLRYQSLPDILGIRLSETLRYCNLAYGSKVDVKTLFNTLLQKTSDVSGTLISCYRRLGGR